jgi:D-alanyl-lipoteichoic acid acyltransferase DltB (MBOAT superfamily)
MLFNSYPFIFLFLPCAFALFFFLNRRKLTVAAKTWLVAASLFFYGYWNMIYVPLIVGSILFNYAVGSSLNTVKALRQKRYLLVTGIIGNLGLLAYFKYMDFFITSVNQVFSSSIPLLHIVLPLGISFFTFTQIAYLVDTSRGTAKEYSLVNYFLFVTFFPHLLAGPIIHHKEMMPQFDRLRNKLINDTHIAQGLSLFFIGLFKKVIIADTFSPIATTGFDHLASLTFAEAWVTSLSYTLQLYFDFSGYTDMALGSSLLFNIRLPENFNTPYTSLSIQDFWRRWHMTLSRFVRDYIYIPLGGNRTSEPRIFVNIIVTFFLVGLWHGAGWTFVIWGLLHGMALLIYRLWQKQPVRLPSPLAWCLTFLFVNAAWVFFRARTFPDALKVLKAMVTPSSFSLSSLPLSTAALVMVPACLILAIFFRNSDTMVKTMKPTLLNALILALISLTAILNLQRVSEFIYFNF